MRYKMLRPAAAGTASGAGIHDVPGRNFDNGNYILAPNGGKAAAGRPQLSGSSERVAGGTRWTLSYFDPATQQDGLSLRVYARSPYDFHLSPCEDLQGFARPLASEDKGLRQRARLFNALCRHECRTNWRANPSSEPDFGYEERSENDAYWYYLCMIEVDDLADIAAAGLNPIAVLHSDRFWRDPGLIITESLRWLEGPQ